jgi:UDP-2,4-diacetamido-2,4,6-trideoxy-beta-L-altropyranose hydrolase
MSDIICSIRLLLRADSGVGLGHGHVTRIEALARAAIRAGGDARIVSRRLPGHRPPGRDLPPMLWLNETMAVDKNDSACKADAVATLDAARAAGFSFDLVVVDHYDLGPTWERAVREHGVNVVALDDVPGRAHESNQVVEFVPSTLSKLGRISGLEYLPMDFEYDLPKITVPTKGICGLVTFGASDPTNHTMVALDALDQIDKMAPDLLAHAHVVVGASHHSADRIYSRIAGNARRSIHCQVPSLVPLMRSAHIVLTAAGNAMTEAVAAGRRSVAIVTADNQTTLANALAAAGVVHLLPSADTACAKMIADSLMHVAGPGGKDIEEALSNRPVDAFGANRLIVALKPYAR